MGRPVPDLPPHWFQILLALADEDRHGLGIMSDVLERTDGRMKLWPGMLYRNLSKLVEEGLVVEVDTPPGARAAAAGRVLSAHAAGPSRLRRRSAAAERLRPGRAPQEASEGLTWPMPGGSLRSSVCIRADIASGTPGELARAMHACVDREGQRGVHPSVTAARLVLDAVSASILVRRDLRRSNHLLHLSPGDSLMQSILHDLRYSVRLIARAPLFSVLVIATLALAIGANTAIFSVVNGVLLRSLPIREVRAARAAVQGVTAQRMFGFSAPDFVAFRERARSYDGLAAYRTVEFELSGVTTPERIKAARISASLSDVLGVPPALGRAFTSEEDTGRQPVAILSERCGGVTSAADPSAVGKPVMLDRRAYTIVGVMPAGAPFPHSGPRLNNVPAAVFVPISFSDIELRAFGSMYNNTVVARLKADVTMQQARAEAAAISDRWAPKSIPRNCVSSAPTYDGSHVDAGGGRRQRQAHPVRAAGRGRRGPSHSLRRHRLPDAHARGGAGTRTGDPYGARRGPRPRDAPDADGNRRACASPAAGRASHSRGGVGGRCWPRRRSRSRARRRSRSTSACSRSRSACRSPRPLITGLLPAFEASRRDSNAALKEGGRTGGAGGVRQRRIFAGLVTAAVRVRGGAPGAAGGLLIRSFVRLMAVDPGFKSGHVVSAATSLPASGYRQARTCGVLCAAA